LNWSPFLCISRLEVKSELGKEKGGASPEVLTYKIFSAVNFIPQLFSPGQAISYVPPLAGSMTDIEERMLEQEGLLWGPP
jgi:hypothetical protein